jgi:hypothetical protein
MGSEKLYLSLLNSYSRKNLPWLSSYLGINYKYFLKNMLCLLMLPQNTNCKIVF